MGHKLKVAGWISLGVVAGGIARVCGILVVDKKPRSRAARHGAAGFDSRFSGSWNFQHDDGIVAVVDFPSGVWCDSARNECVEKTTLGGEEGG